MASLKIFTHAKNHYIKDWDRVAGKQIHINTGIPHKGESRKKTQALRTKAESFLKRYIKNQRGRDETARLLRKYAENKRSISINDAIDEYLKNKSRSVKVNNRTLIDYKRHLSYFNDHFDEFNKILKF